MSSLVDLLGRRAAAHPDDPLYTFAADGESATERLTYGELAQRARQLAGRLQRWVPPGSRALLVYPPGLDFVVAFFGCLCAEVIAVPTPRPNRKSSRLQGIVEDARPELLLTTRAEVERTESMLADLGVEGLRIVATDDPSDDPADEPVGEWREPKVDGSSLAFLQYTSGSTSNPKGVMVSHDNLLANCADLHLGLEHGRDSLLVSWLPTFHDLGLIYGLLTPLYGEFPVFLTPPIAFLQRPLRWLKAISRLRATHSAAPNFAFDLAVKKCRERAGDLDLSSWQVALVGAEPVRLHTLEAFAEAFAPAGFRRSSFSPGYGLAEATLKVTAARRGDGPTFSTVDSLELANHRVRFVPADHRDAVAIAGCGRSEIGTEVVLVEPERRTRCAADEVGEIWVRGETVAGGYWGRPEETAAVFAAHRADGEGPYLRTGDLGFLHRGELYITGRIKDLLILTGRNLYPQDIELSVEQSHPNVRSSGCAAFSVDAFGEERLVVAFELERRPPVDPKEVIRAIRRAVSDDHDVAVHAVVPLRAGSIPKTSSGKIQRRACRAAYLDGTLEEVGAAGAAVAQEVG